MAVESASEANRLSEVHFLLKVQSNGEDHDPLWCITQWKDLAVDLMANIAILTEDQLHHEIVGYIKQTNDNLVGVFEALTWMLCNATRKGLFENKLLKLLHGYTEEHCRRNEMRRDGYVPKDAPFYEEPIVLGPLPCLVNFKGLIAQIKETKPLSLQDMVTLTKIYEMAGTLVATSPDYWNTDLRPGALMSDIRNEHLHEWKKKMEKIEHLK